MVICEKCGQENKMMGMCKFCGFVNAPKQTFRERINEMSRKQKVLGSAIAGVNALWFVGGIVGSVIIAIIYICAAVMGQSEFSELMSSLGYSHDNELIRSVHTYVSWLASSVGDVFFITLCVALSAVGVAVGIFMVICTLKGTVCYGWKLNVIQVFWIVAAVVSMCGLTDTLWVITYTMAILMSILLVVYRKYEFST